MCAIRLARGTPVVADSCDRGDGTNDGSDSGFYDGPAHGETHCPGCVRVDEEVGDETEADAGGYDGAGEGLVF